VLGQSTKGDRDRRAAALAIVSDRDPLFQFLLPGQLTNGITGRGPLVT